MATDRLGVIVLLLICLSDQGAEACGWRTSALNGTVQSPKFPKNYHNRENCVYVITAPSNYRVTLNFTHFDLEGTGSVCRYDYVEIRDGGSEDSPLLGRYCGTWLQITVRTFGNQMRIKFVSDRSTTKSGFRATYTSANLKSPVFLITSSEYIFSPLGDNILKIDAETRSNYSIPLAATIYVPVAVDYDPVERTIYWTEAVGPFKGIRRAALNGSDVHTILDAGNDSFILGLAVDPLSRLIFYTDMKRNLIAMLTMPTFAHKTIISTSLYLPRAIVLNTADGVMFWSNIRTVNKIERANYDGSDRRTLVRAPVDIISALALDVPNNRLYWVDSGSSRVEMSDMEGKGRTVLLELNNTHHLNGLALLQGYLYITNWAKENTKNVSYLVRLKTADGNTTNYGSFTGIRLNDIQAYMPDFSSNNTNHGCGDNNGGCDVICIPLPGSRRKCMCPDGQHLDSDQQTCVDHARKCRWNSTALTGTVRSPNFPQNYADGQSCIYVITAPSNYVVTLNFTDFDLEESKECRFDYVEIRNGDNEDSPFLGRYCGSSMPRPQRTFGNQMWIKFASDKKVTGSGFRATFTSAFLHTPFFLVTSSVPGSTVKGSIHRIDFETESNYEIPLSTTLSNPMAVDYDPVGENIYWTEVGLFKGVWTAALNGSGVQRILDTGADSVLDGMAVDHLSRLIFYTDAGRDLIAMLIMSTFAHKTIISTSLDQPRDIVLDTVDGLMFWTDRGVSPKIERANYDGSDRRTLVNTLLYYINALALDVPNNRLYWADSGTDRVEVSDMEGNGRKVLLTMVDKYNPFDLALLGDSVFFTTRLRSRTETVKGLVMRLRLDSLNLTLYGTISGEYFNGIHAYSPQSSSDRSRNGCSDKNAECDVICIPLPSSNSKCMCPDGQRLNNDQRTCVEDSGQTSKNSTSIIAGGIAGAVVVIIVVVVVFIVIKRRGRKAYTKPSKKRRAPREDVYSMLDARRIPPRDDRPSAINVAPGGHQDSSIYEIPENIF